MAKLLPCPFCGNEDIHITQSFPHYVYCLDCGMMVQLAGKAYVKDIPKIIKVWNMRAQEEGNVLLGVWADNKLRQARTDVLQQLREKCTEHQDFHKGDDGVFRGWITIEDLDYIISDMFR